MEALPAWHQEIVELHEFFEGLFLGAIDSLDRADRALASDFSMAGPDGSVSDRAMVLSQLDAGRAHTTELSITIPHATLILETDAVVVAEYLEAHGLRNGRGNERRTTVVFRKDPDGPNGLRWVRAHETWIDRA